MSLLLACLLLSGTGCPRTTAPPAPPAPVTPVQVKKTASDTDLILKLPASRETPADHPDRVTKLTINGVDEPVTAGEAKELTVNVDAADVGKTIKVVYSYWPSGYSNTIRTKEVKVESGKKIPVDFNIEDAAHPDLIKPIYVPTRQETVEQMCEFAKVGKGDVVYDIGCGDGRMVITSVKKYGAKRGVGVDIDPELVKLCQKNATDAGVADKVKFRNENALLMKELSDATVVLLYVGEDFGAKLEPVLRKTLKPGARVVSNRFPLGDWQPDEEEQITEPDHKQYKLKLWTIK
jgi:SAM-dependent methyltransferase